jgi:hypothetical protein
MMPRAPFSPLAAAKERQEERNNNQNGFFFRWGEGAISPAPKKDDGARCCGKGASLSRAQWEQTRHNNQKESCVRMYHEKRKRQQFKWFYFSFVGERAPFSAKER